MRTSRRIPARVSRQSNTGFTLIEILVVLAIVAALIGLVTPILFKTQEQGERAATAADLQKMKLALKERVADPKVGDVPPTSLAAAGFESPNDLNEGIEVLVATLGATDATLNPFEDEARLINTDGDRDPRRTTYQQSKEFFEYADAWGNPFIYFRLRDFESNPDAKVRYQTKDGEIIEVGPVRSQKSGTFAGISDGYQLISMGPDEEYGNDDDVVSWRSN
jgi:prepilin-type N-terminal cleavage/methylation domain-containing protein